MIIIKKRLIAIPKRGLREHDKEKTVLCVYLTVTQSSPYSEVDEWDTP